MKVNRRFMTPEEVKTDIFSERIYLVKMTGQGTMEMRKTNSMTVKALYQALADGRSIFVEISEELDDES